MLTTVMTGHHRNRAFTIAAAAALSLMVVSIAAWAQVPIVGNHADEAAELAGGGTSAPRSLRISIAMALRNREELQKLIADQQDPSSALYHRWLTPAEFSDRFGPTADGIAQVEIWLTKAGFSVESARLSRRTVVATAPVPVIEKALALKIGSSADGSTFANLSDPIVPSSIAPLIASIRGLGNTIRVHRDVAVSETRVTPDATQGGRTAFGPKDMWTFYDEAALNAAGTTGTGADCIALIEASDFEDTAVTVFDATFGLPPATVSRVLVDGTNPGVTGGDATTEADLDVEYAHAAAPGAPIAAYLGSGPNGLVDGISQAVTDDTCGAISISFEFCGEGASFYKGTLDPLFAQAAAQGQAVFASAGDEGAAGTRAASNGCVIARRQGVSELAADPNVTAVGGTQSSPTFDQSGNVTGYSTESVWRDVAPIPKTQRGAGGGGRSAVFTKPSYQSGVFPKDKRRSIPDISFAASPSQPGFFFAEGAAVTCCIGGTSIGAPIWAGITALASQSASVARIGGVNPKLYSLGPSGNTSSSGLHDVTSGKNGLNGVQGFKAKPGYDRATGLGTPDIGILVPLLGQ